MIAFISSFSLYIFHSLLSILFFLNCNHHQLYISIGELVKGAIRHLGWDSGRSPIWGKPLKSWCAFVCVLICLLLLFLGCTYSHFVLGVCVRGVLEIKPLILGHIVCKDQTFTSIIFFVVQLNCMF